MTSSKNLLKKLRLEVPKRRTRKIKETSRLITNEIKRGANSDIGIEILSFQTLSEGAGASFFLKKRGRRKNGKGGGKGPESPQLMGLIPFSSNPQVLVQERVNSRI